MGPGGWRASRAGREVIRVVTRCTIRPARLLSIAAALMAVSCGGRETEGPSSTPAPIAPTESPRRDSDSSPDRSDPLTGATPPAGFWEALCRVQLGRVVRCGENVGYHSLEACLGATYDRACSELLDARSAALLIDYLEQAPCRPGAVIMNSVQEPLLEMRALSGDEKTAQESCSAMMRTCPPTGRVRCIAPLLKEPYRTRVFKCYAFPCETIWRCTETVLEEGGCP